LDETKSKSSLLPYLSNSLGNLRQTVVNFFQRSNSVPQTKKIEQVLDLTCMPPLVDFVDLSQEDELYLNSEPQEIDLSSDLSADFGSPTNVYLKAETTIKHGPSIKHEPDKTEDNLDLESSNFPVDVDLDNPDPIIASQQRRILKSIEDNKVPASGLKRARSDSATTTAKKQKNSVKRICSVPSIQSPSNASLKQSSVQSFFTPKS